MIVNCQSGQFVGGLNVVCRLIDVEEARVRDTGTVNKHQRDDVVFGDDWVAPTQVSSKELQAKREARGFFSLNSSPLTRKIIIFNLIALILLVAGILYLNASRQSLVAQRADALVVQASLVSDVFEARLDAVSGGDLTSDSATSTFAGITLERGVEGFVFDSGGQLLFDTKGTNQAAFGRLLDDLTGQKTFIIDTLEALWKPFRNKQKTATDGELSPEALKILVSRAFDNSIAFGYVEDSKGGTVFSATVPIVKQDSVVGVIAITSRMGEIDALARFERERVLQMFAVALLVSIGLSFALASTIANPLADLAEAAELGRDRNTPHVKPGPIRIPDLSARPDEIGRLSRALRGMVKTLYNRIDSNEQFAADVAHEIKNPLASLQSAVGTLRMVKREDQQEKLMNVIEHDVQRLDRLVSDISNASRLDAELVKEEEDSFNLIDTLENLNQFLGEDARVAGIDYITELPNEAVTINGLEARLAQVFVNLITNAISFCEDGDAIRVWARRRGSRVLVVVEDTGPGIPEQALSKVFTRFYSQRPEEHFGNNSGLGLAISKQIIEAHGGVIWAENIRPTAADLTSEPLGARFVVGLPV